MKKLHFGSKSAFTLIEVVVSSILSTMVIGGIYSGIQTGMNLNYASAQNIAAFGLCQERLEQMRGTVYSDITSTTFPEESLFLTHLGGSERLPLTATRSSTIADLTNPARKEVTVTVSWDYRGRALSQSITGFVYLKE